MIASLVLGKRLFTELLEMRLGALRGNFIDNTHEGLSKCIAIAEEHTLFLPVFAWSIFMEQTLEDFQVEMHMDRRRN